VSIELPAVKAHDSATVHPRGFGVVKEVRHGIDQVHDAPLHRDDFQRSRVSRVDRRGDDTDTRAYVLDLDPVRLRPLIDLCREQEQAEHRNKESDADSAEAVPLRPRHERGR
jgi:hypothetical protein